MTSIPKCVAETQDQLSAQGFFRSTQWSADGTCLITNSADNHIRTYVVPSDLLEDHSKPQILKPYSTISSHEPVNTLTVYPHFNLTEPSTTLILSSIRDHPIRLNSALTSDLLASYPLINTTTEAYITPSALHFHSTGTHFIAGSDSLISTFDISRPGQDPISSVQTGPKSRKSTRFNPATSMRGIVSALSISPDTEILAAGTFTRSIALYSANSSLECLGSFTLRGNQADKTIGGGGITQLLWSPCGRYLYIAERKSNGIMVYDIRKTGQLVSWCEGRKADTNQRLGVDLIGLETEHSEGGCEVWAGGVDGMVRMWKDPQLREGSVSPVTKWVAHDDAVSGTALHRSGGVIATSSGQRHWDIIGHGDVNGVDAQVEPEDNSSSQSTPRISKANRENSLKIWSF